MQPSAPYTVVETLYESEGTSLYRALGPDRVPVILKVLDPRRCRPKALDRQRSEYEFGRTLDLPAIARPLALDTFQGMPALVIEDFGGQPLDVLVGEPLPIDRFLDLAARIASAVAEIHRQGVVHKDLKPQNILVNRATGEVRLADFGLASRLPREQETAKPAQMIEGSLPYMSPEQTGRMNRAVDSRTDLYSLGVVFYQMLTGRLPFEAHDPPEWVHCHVARTPTPPSRVAPGIPEPVARIVLKLLAKTAEDRYQTAGGVRHDLARCLDAWRARGRIDPFPLGERDASDRLQIPQRLFGRDEELAILLRAFERVVDTGLPELVLVSGYSGIGKSSLVHELQEPIVRQRGMFVPGKFDRLERDAPYSTIVEVLREVVLDILAESEERLGEWKRRLQEALDSSAQLIVEVIPQLELVIGRQPAVPELPPAEAQNRFRVVFRRFIGVFARRERPLTIFLDDVQWADPASLALLQDLVTPPGVPSLLVVGAYRDNEVGPAHPLSSMLEAVRAAGARVSGIVLGPLSGEDLTAFVAAALRCQPDDAAPLAALVREKTAANPFFAIQFLTLLHDERLIEFDGTIQAWRWDLARIRARSITDNVAELVVGKLRRLPPSTQEALKQLACLGDAADIGTLMMVLDRPDAETQAVLWEALRAGLIVRAGGAYRFLHDRVREAAYSLLTREERPAAHLRIGHLLLSRRVRRLELLAGRKAKAAIAYASARGYLHLATVLLPPDAWRARHEETFELYLDLAECEYLVGAFARAGEVLDALLGEATSDLDRARVHLLRLELYQGSGRFEDAWTAGLDALRLFGIAFPDTKEEIAASFQAEQQKIRLNLCGRRIADLVEAPVLVAPDLAMALRLLIETWVPAYNARPEYHPLLIVTAVNFALRHGHTAESGLAYSGYAVLLVALFGDIPSALEFADVALLLADRFDDPRSRAGTIGNYGAQIHHWRKPLATSVPIMERGFRAFQEIGDLAHAGITAILAAWTAVVEKGEPLDGALEASEKYLAFAIETRNDTVRDALRLIRQLVPALKGTTREPASLEDDGFSESACLAAFRRASFGAGIALRHILKQVVAFLYGRYDEAFEAAAQHASAPGPVSAFLYDATHHLFRALTAAALHARASAHEQQELARILEQELQRHAPWAESCPENFLHRHALISAEVARIEGRELEAERLYERAIRSAHENGFIQHEAIALELASQFHRARGFELAADAYLREARAHYAYWGAAGKVKQIDEHHPRLLKPRPVAPSATFVARTEQLDLLSVAKVAQTISGEIVLDKLLRTLLQVVLEQSGARRGCLLLARDADHSRGSERALSIEAEAIFEDEGVRATLRSTPLNGASDRVPVSIVQYVARTKEPMILDAAAGAGRFSSDEYVARRKPRSLLCLPILRQGEVAGILYLENDLLSGVFTPERLIALELLATQAAISVENAGLLADERAARAAAEAEKRRFAFLAEAGALLSKSLDPEETLARLAGICVESFADWCTIDLLVDGGREVRRLAGAHALAEKEPVLRELERRYPARLDSGAPAAEVIRTGEPFLLPEVCDDDIRAGSEDDDHAELIRQLGTRSVLAVPLVARGQTLGVITLCSSRPGRRYGRADLELARELANRAAIALDNARLYRESQEAIRMRDEFLSIASHELFTPITSLMLSLEAMLPSASGAGGEALDARAMRKLLDLVLRQGRRLIRLIGDLLDVSRIQTGRLVLQLGEVELDTLVHEVVERHEPDIARSRCTVSVSASAPVHGRWDRSRLDQVVTNLLSNSMKFGAGKPIEIAIAAERGLARLVVRDRGIGIHAALQARIFHRFERAVSSEHYGGLGLGLYISRRIVEAHGGSIRVESEPDAGSTFTVELPCAGPL